ncbi:MAG TPA: PIN domain-containing protein, partial [Candidatus Nitrosotenuis sp.]|nr:PIN domain-containing protein [Candidatus Nitrosotenuis sp.]
MAKKIYILDTSVLLHRPESLFDFADNDLILPVVVLDELDTFKRGSMEINRNARVVIKYIDDLRLRGPLDKGVRLDNGGTFTINLNDRNALELLPPGFAPSNDNRILATALAVEGKNKRRKVVLVSKDINMRVKAQALGLHAEDYRHDQIVALDELYTGQMELPVGEEVVDRIYRERSLAIDELRLSPPPAPNQFVMLSANGAGHTALSRYDGASRTLQLLRELRHDVWGLRPLNR